MLDRRYHVIKSKDDKSITYFEYDKMDGYDLSPKKGIKIEDAINVNKVVIINPSLANKVANKKLNIKFRKLVGVLNVIFETDDETGSAYHQGLDEVNRLRMELINKYKKHLSDEEVDIFEKKLGILEHELKIRLHYLEQQMLYREENVKEGKSR